MGLLSRALGFAFPPVKPSASIAPPASRVNMTAFDAGKSARRLRGMTTTTEMINRQIRVYGRTILARSRYLCANNPYAAAAKEVWVNALVGDGIVPSPILDSDEQKKELKLVWRQWTDESDADGLTDFYGQQAIIAGEMFEAGECFVRLRPRRFPDDGLTVPLQLQIIPAEMLDLQYNVSASQGQNRIECGIEFDAIGRRVAYHFWRNHPGNDVYQAVASSLQRTRVSAAEILHLYKPMAAGQIRGLPHTISSIVKLAVLDSYEDAELERKRTAALFAGYVTKPDATDDDHPLENNLDAGFGIPELPGAVGLEPGAIFDLGPGEDVTWAEPADVGATYEPFIYRNLLGVAAGFGVPYSDMTGDLRQTSYGSQRGGVLTFRRRIGSMQHQVMVFQLCRPVWNRWMNDAILVGAVERIPRASYLAAPKLFQAVRWMPPKWDWIDPLKDRQAEKIAVDEGWKSRDDVIEAEGYDPEENDERIAASEERAEALGIEVGTPPPAPPGFGGDPDDEDGPPANEPPPPADDPPARRRRERTPRAETEPEPEDEPSLIAALVEATRELARPRPPAQVNVAVHVPKQTGQRTKVISHDESGRIKETETTPIIEE